MPVAVEVGAVEVGDVVPGDVVVLPGVYVDHGPSDSGRCEFVVPVLPGVVFPE